MDSGRAGVQTAALYSLEIVI